MYECDNDVCDSQMVNLMFEGGTVANLTMTAFSKEVIIRDWREGGRGVLMKIRRKDYRGINEDFVKCFSCKNWFSS